MQPYHETQLTSVNFLANAALSWATGPAKARLVADDLMRLADWLAANPDFTLVSIELDHSDPPNWTLLGWRKA